MEPLIELGNFLSNPPGNLVFILVVAFTLIGALQIGISFWSISGEKAIPRPVIGLSILLGIQLVLFLISGLIGQNVFQGTLILPVIDRVAILLSLTWLLWLWLFPEPSRPGDFATLLLSILLVIAAVLAASLYLETNPQVGTYNSSYQAILWDAAGILISFLGIVFLLIRKPVNWGNGLVLALLALTGFSLDILVNTGKGDFSGIIRFFLLAGFPLVLTVPTHYALRMAGKPKKPDEISPGATQELESKVDQVNIPGESAPDQPNHRLYGSEPKILQTLLSLATETDSKKINQKLVQSIAQTLLVDLCFLILLDDDQKSLIIASGYDLIREEGLESGNIPCEVIPEMANEMFLGHPLLISSQEPHPDLNALQSGLGLTNLGSVLCAPVKSESGLFGSLLFLSPYSNREWNQDDQAFLAGISPSIAAILEGNKYSDQIQLERDLAQRTSRETAEQILQLKTNNADLTMQVELLQKQLELNQVEMANQKDLLLSLSIQLEQSRVKSDWVPVRVEHPEHASYSQLEKELRSTLIELAQFQNQLAESNKIIFELQSKSEREAPASSRDLIISISQELRQPMTSIVGYTELLLGESVGILGALQRKFLERIKNSTNRIGSLVDDLIQITTMEKDRLYAISESVDFNEVIDNVLAYTANQMREKNISMRIDIPEGLKPLYLDKESLQQILIHLIQNAGAVTPVGGEILLKVWKQTEDESDFVIVQVSDMGGGIESADLPKVFTRLYRADSAMIPGIGDTGIGLSIAKTLTEGQNGRIWVESNPGTGSTFSISIPLIETPLPAGTSEGN